LPSENDRENAEVPQNTGKFCCYRTVFRHLTIGSMLRYVLLASPLRGASKRRQQTVQRLIADDLASARLPRPDGDVTDTLMGAFGVGVPNIFNGSMAQAIFREEDHVFRHSSWIERIKRSAYAFMSGA